MTRYCRLYTTVILLFMSVLTNAQTATITGLVSDASGNALEGVTVWVPATKAGTLTNAKGAFKLDGIQLNKDTIAFSYVGFKEQRMTVRNDNPLQIVMESASQSLNTVVLVGYGKTKKRDITGASVQVSGKSIEELNIPRMDQALQGQVSGVNISTNSGSPGGSSSIRIRGLSTFGDNDPLIVVDGIIYDSEGLNALNPNDIESINIIKDATAGIYGVRAANGVIIITTKKGAKNTKPQYVVSMYKGSQSTANKLSLLNATEYAVLKNEMFANGGDDLPFNNTQLGEGTNWQDSVFQAANIESYNISISGGSQNTAYSIGFSYFNQDGIVGLDKANFNRTNARVNFTTDLSKKLTLTNVLLYTNEERNVLPENGIGSVLYNTINAFPTAQIRDENGNFTYLDEVNDIINPIAQMQNTYNTTWVNKFVGKEELSYEINENIDFVNRFNYNVALVDNKIFSPLVFYGVGKAQNTALNADLDPTQVEIAPGALIDRGASVTEIRSTYTDLNYESFINHNLKFRKIHRLNSTLGVSIFSRAGQSLAGTAYNLPGNTIEFADISANLAPGGFLNNVSSFQFQERLLSVFYRAQYKYQSKYNATLIVRRDGSSKFGPNNRYGTFPTVAGSWVISEEDFYKSKKVPFAKLRASLGISGNDQIANFAYRGLLNGEGVYVFDDIITTGIAIGRASNPDLKWETTAQFNAGFDMNITKRFSLTANYFIKNTRDLLFQPEVSAVLGTAGAGSSAPVVNAGDVSNKGVELEFKYEAVELKKWKVTAGINGTYLKNVVTSVPDGVDFIPGAPFGVGGAIATRFEQGFPIGYFIGYETDGVFQTQYEIENAAVVQDGAKPGDLKYVDQNGDGKISFSDDSDKIMLGSPIPDFTFGLNTNVAYKNFDISAFLFAAIGQEIVRNFERQQPYANMLDYNINRWNGPGSNNDYHRLTTERTRNTVFSDYYVEDGSFVRLRNVQIGYTLPDKLMKKYKLQGLRVYLASNNLLTFTNYQGFDPDIGTAGGTLSAGVDYGFYPQARSFMAGLTLKF